MSNEREIESYLLNQMPLNERISFESRLKEDEELQKRLSEQRKFLNDLENIGRLAVYEKSEDLKFLGKKTDTQPVEQQKKSGFVIGSTIGYTLVFVIIGLAAFISDRYDPIKSFSNLKAFSYYFEPISVNNIFEEQDYGALEKSKQEAINRYTSQQYEEALEIFKDIDDTESEDAILLMEAITHLNSGDTKIATDQLETLSLKNNKFSEHAQWYLALAHMKENHLEQTKKLLLEINQQSGIYHNKASELLKVLIPLTSENVSADPKK